METELEKASTILLISVSVLACYLSLPEPVQSYICPLTPTNVTVLCICLSLTEPSSQECCSVRITM
jgi:hypothetical protein